MITQREYSKRRKKLAQSLKKNSLALVLSATPKCRSHDTEYPYRQNSSFYYLSGFKEDNAALLIIKRKKAVKTILFVQKKDKTLELWNGYRLGEIEAKKRFFFDEVYTIDELEKYLLEYAQESTTFYYDFQDEGVKKYSTILDAINSHKNIIELISYLRLIKSNAEIQLIKRAIEITKNAHHQAMGFKKVAKFEYELQAEIEYIFKKSGAYSDAYTSIVACGNAANTLHYIENSQKLVDKKLILIDAGCEYDYYASDITRTIPVNGKFTKAQKELYEMVLDVELEIISMIRPKVKRSLLQERAVDLLTQGMMKLKILSGDKKELIKSEAYKKYYPHGIGHWMGLDVHDDAPYKDKFGNEILLQKGMVLTIEPGIYIDENERAVPKKYRGIGIRIEDDILVSKDGCINLSEDIAKSVEAIEKISN